MKPYIAFVSPISIFFTIFVEQLVNFYMQLSSLCSILSISDFVFCDIVQPFCGLFYKDKGWYLGRHETYVSIDQWLESIDDNWPISGLEMKTRSCLIETWLRSADDMLDIILQTWHWQRPIWIQIFLATADRIIKIVSGAHLKF